jgi:hypothetical protein
VRLFSAWSCGDTFPGRKQRPVNSARLRSLHTFQKPEAGFAKLHYGSSSSWVNAGGLSTVGSLQHLQSVRLTQEARFSEDESHTAFKKSVVVAQMPALTALLDLVEAVLFEALA